jgi:hypothetical protein
MSSREVRGNIVLRYRPREPSGFPEDTFLVDEDIIDHGVIRDCRVVREGVWLMQIRGIVMRAELVENPPGSDRIELVLWGQGVGPDKPRSIVVPYELLLQDPSLDAEQIRGHGFQAVISQDEEGRWVVDEISFATGNVLRPE